MGRRERVACWEKAAGEESCFGQGSHGQWGQVSALGSPNTTECSSSGANTGPVPFSASEMKTRLGQAELVIAPGDRTQQSSPRPAWRLPLLSLMTD